MSDLDDTDFRKGLMASYLGSLTNLDFDSLTNLFTPDATITSPLLGEIKASVMLAKFKATSAQNVITIRELFLTGPRNGDAAAMYHHRWALCSGKTVELDCVGVFSFDPAGHRITAFKLFYDTHPVRAIIEQAYG